MKQYEWLIINYTLPREPSRSRVAVWRKLKKTGAVSIQQSMWILPFTNENHMLFKEIKSEVLQNGGEAFIMTSSADEYGKKIIIDQFNAARNEEYGEFLEQCTEFFNEIDKEIKRKNFTYAEIEENEEDLLKLKEWFSKISSRDAFGATYHDKAKEQLARCAEKLDDFCNQVFNCGETGL